MIDLFGDEIKARKRRKPTPRIEARVAYQIDGRRHPAWVNDAKIESLAGPVSKLAFVWLVTTGPVSFNRLVAAYSRLKKAGYRHLFYTAYSE